MTEPTEEQKTAAALQQMYDATGARKPRPADTERTDA